MTFSHQRALFVTTLWEILSLSLFGKSSLCPPFGKGQGGFEKKMSFFIKSPLTPLCQRGEERGALPKRGRKRGFAKEGETEWSFSKEGN